MRSIKQYFQEQLQKWRELPNKSRFFRRIVLRGLAVVGLLLLTLGILVGSMSIFMPMATESYILTADSLSSVAQDKPFDCVLVLGAGLTAEGTPSPMLYDRVKVGCDAYHLLGGNMPLLMSGDHTGDYNEVSAMAKQAKEFEVEEEDIFLDPQGYSTYESMVNASATMRGKRVLIVTQTYHLYRAIYIARSLGMDAYGISADLRPYRGQVRYDLREMLARYKDFFYAAQKRK